MRSALMLKDNNTSDEYVSDRRLIRVTRIRLRTGYSFCWQIRVTRISPR